MLLVKRAKPPFSWAFPGGLVEFGETSLQAALRELHEETGVVAELPQFLGLYEVIRPEAHVHFAIACHAGRWLSGEAVAASDAADARWFLPEETSGLELAPNIAEALAKARAQFPA